MKYLSLTAIVLLADAQKDGRVVLASGGEKLCAKALQRHGYGHANSEGRWTFFYINDAGRTRLNAPRKV